MLLLLLSACTPDCGEGFTKGEDGACQADTGGGDTDTDTDTDADTDADTDTDVEPVSATLSGTLTVIGETTPKGICTVALWGFDQLVDGQPPSTGEPRGGAQVTCPSNGSVAWEAVYNDTGGETAVTLWAMVEPDGDRETHDSQRTPYPKNPVTVKNDELRTGLDWTVTLGKSGDTGGDTGVIGPDTGGGGDTATPDTGAPETGAPGPDTGVVSPDTGAPADTAAADTGAPPSDTAAADTGAPSSDTAAADTGAASPDTGAADTDTGTPSVDTAADTAASLDDGGAER